MDFVFGALFHSMPRYAHVYPCVEYLMKDIDRRENLTNENTYIDFAAVAQHETGMESQTCIKEVETLVPSCSPCPV